MSGAYECGRRENHFTSLAAFDQHWPAAPASCLPPAEAGLELGAHGRWQIPVTPEQRARLESFRKLSSRNAPSGSPLATNDGLAALSGPPQPERQS